MSDDRYTHVNRRKFDLKVHIVLVVKYRKRLLVGEMGEALKGIVNIICDEHGWNIVACETDKDHVHLMVEYDTTVRVCDIVKVIKQVTTHEMWVRFPELMGKNFWKRKIFWSDGYFACSIGEVSAERLKHYIENQG